MYQIQGAYSFEPRRRLPGGAGILALLLFVAVAFAFVRSREGPLPKAQNVISPMSGIPSAYSEDLQHHIVSVQAALSSALQQLRKSQDTTRRAIPSLERNGLTLERARLETVAGASDAARRAIAQASEELEVINSLLKERSKP